MDWPQFLASVIHWLAWPVTVLIVLFIIRRHLGTLIARIVELTLPGGAKIVFAAEVDKGRGYLQELGILETKSLPAGAIKFLRNADAVQSFEPQTAIAVSYEEVVNLLLELRSMLQLTSQSNLPTVMGKLVKRNLVPQEVRDLFNSVSLARNTAAHAAVGQITPVEAYDLIKQISVLLVELQKAKIKLAKEGK